MLHKNEYLINIRESNGLSQKEFARKLKTSTVTIVKWENGQKNPDDNSILVIAKTFGLTYEECLNNLKKK